MTTYQTQSKDFALSDDGVHLLRNGFNYQTISYNDIHKAAFTMAVETKNVALMLGFGTLLIAFSLYNTIGVFENFNDPLVHRIYVESIVLPVLPFLLGLYCIYISVKKVPTLLIELNNKKHKLSIQEFVKHQHVGELESYLKVKLGSRFYETAHRF
jgi:hypothetical protein